MGGRGHGHGMAWHGLRAMTERAGIAGEWMRLETDGRTSRGRQRHSVSDWLTGHWKQLMCWDLAVGT